jgi:hypothetical protein
MQTALTFLSPPKSQLAEVLYGLIMENEISERDFVQNGFRSRLTNLRKLGLDIQCQWKEFTSKYGHPGKYKVHYLLTIDKGKATQVYEKLNR